MSSTLQESALLPVRALPLSHVRLDVECASMNALFATVARLLARPERPQPEQVVQRLRSRHQRSSPAVGQGFAVPHAAVPVIRRPLAVYLRLRKPLRLLDADEEPVSDCLALLVPTPGFLADHELLKHVHAVLGQSEAAYALRACTDAASVRRYLTGLR